MRKLTKKSLSIFLTGIMILSLIAGITVPTNITSPILAEVTSNNTGETIQNTNDETTPIDEQQPVEGNEDETTSSEKESETPDATDSSTKTENVSITETGTDVFEGILQQKMAEVNDKCLTSINQSDRADLSDRSLSQENVDLPSGQLNLMQTDLTLPGKDGFDLTIGRVFSSNQAVMGKRCSRVVGPKSWGQLDEEERLYFQNNCVAFNNGGTTPVVLRADQWEYLLEDSGYTVYQYEAGDEGRYYYFKSYTNNTCNLTYSQSHLGTGWEFAFPYVENYDNGNGTTLVYHNGQGQAWQANTTKKTLRDYPEKNIKFEKIGTTNPKYKFTDPQGKQYLFYNSGCLETITDRIGNVITFTYDGDNKLITITDTLNRTISFQYTDYANDSGNIEVTVNSGGNFIKIIYTRDSVSFRDRENITRHVPRLKQVEIAADNTEKKTIEYSYKELVDSFYDFFYNGDVGPSQPLNDELWGTQKVLQLESVKYPLSETYYEFEKHDSWLGQSGGYLIGDYRISKRYDKDLVSGTQRNVTHYDCPCNYREMGARELRGFPADYKCTVTNETTSGNLTSANTYFYGKLQKTEITDGDITKTISYKYENDDFKYKPTRITTIDEGSGSVTSTTINEYNDWGGLSRTDEDGHITEYSYGNTITGNEYLLTSKSWNQSSGQQCTELWDYDNVGRLKSYTDAENQTTNYVPNDTTHTLTVTKTLENGKTAESVITYGDSYNNAYPTKIEDSYTDTNGTSRKLTTTKTYYKLSGLLHTVTDSTGLQVSYDYDKLGRTTAITTGTSGITKNVTYSYSNPTWNGAKATLVECNATENGTLYAKTDCYYNAYGQLREEIVYNCKNESPSSITTQKYDYDSNCLPVSAQDAMNNIVNYAYDAWGNCKLITDPYQNQYVTKYLPGDRKTINSTITGDEGTINECETQKDRWGRVIGINSYGISESYDYDNNGNLTTYTDPKGQSTYFGYDRINQLLTVTDPRNQVTQYTYTKLGKLQSVELPSNGGHSVGATYNYDELGRIQNKTETGDFKTTYNMKNNIDLLSTVAKPNGTAISYNYDDLNRVDTETRGNVTLTYGYDYYGIQSVSTTEMTTSYTRDGFGRVTGNTTIIDGKSLGSIITEYDNLNRILDMTDAGSTFGVHYDYDRTRLDKVQLDGAVAKNTSAPAADYDYYNDGKLKFITLPGAAPKTEFKYDNLRRVTNVINESGTTTLSQFSYDYDSNGNITQVTDSRGTTVYGYDELNRLETIYRAGTEIARYQYDPWGNRLQINGEKPKPVAGNVISSFDSWDRLETFTRGGQTTTFTYEPSGLRVKKVSPNGTKYYSYDQNTRVIAVYNGSNKIASYLWGPDRLLATKIEATGMIYYYVYNGHGDVVQIVDETGAEINKYEYDEWGNITNQEEGIFNEFKYAGEIYDSETGLYYLRARYYDPVTGRFISKDSMEGDVSNPLSLNLYTYCANNPMIYVDPDGHVFMLVTGGLGVVAGGVIGGIYSYNKYGKVRWQNITAGALAGGLIGLTGGAGAAYLTTGGVLASTGTVVSGATAVFGGTSAIILKGIDSVWKLRPFERAQKVEEALGGWGNNFPVIDKAGRIVDGIRQSITSIKSLDIFARSYRGKDAIYNQIIKYASQLQKFQGATWGQTIVNVSSSTLRILELAIPKGATAEQMIQINNAITEAANMGIQVTTKIFQ
ncbi:MAG: RHS repeat-associated core domain-containing protein [Chitinophagales bacterium]